MHKVTLRLVNNSTNVDVEMGTTLMDVLCNTGISMPYPVLVARVNNAFKSLGYRIFKPVTVEFLDMRSFEGYRVYQRTLSFVMQRASLELFPDRKLRIRHTLGNGFYAEYDDNIVPTAEDVALLKQRMQDIVAQDIPIRREKRLAEEVAKEYANYGFDDRLELLSTRPRLYRTVNYLGEMPGYFYGELAPSTAYVERFDIAQYYNGLYVALPARTNPDVVTTTINHDKMFDIFHEYQQWAI